MPFNGFARKTHRKKLKTHQKNPKTFKNALQAPLFHLNESEATGEHRFDNKNSFQVWYHQNGVRAKNSICGVLKPIENTRKNSWTGSRHQYRCSMSLRVQVQAVSTKRIFEFPYQKRLKIDPAPTKCLFRKWIGPIWLCKKFWGYERCSRAPKIPGGLFGAVVRLRLIFKVGESKND